MRSWKWMAIGLVTVALVAMIGVGGCAQETGKNKTVDRTDQQTSPVSTASQRDYQRGATLTWNIYNAPARGMVTPATADGGTAMPSPQTGGVPQSQPACTLRGLPIGNGQLGEALASYQQSGFVFTVTIGDTAGQASQTPTQTATGGSATTTQNPSTSGKLAPDVQVNPSLAAAAPGGTANATASATKGTGSGTATGGETTSSPTQSAMQANIKSAADQISQIFQNLLSAWLQTQPAKTEPTTQPAS